jgi:hypothetical protein
MRAGSFERERGGVVFDLRASSSERENFDEAAGTELVGHSRVRGCDDGIERRDAGPSEEGERVSSTEVLGVVKGDHEKSPDGESLPGNRSAGRKIRVACLRRVERSALMLPKLAQSFSVLFV